MIQMFELVFEFLFDLRFSRSMIKKILDSASRLLF
jgi:hypothetical protein